jgi:ribonuclease G
MGTPNEILINATPGETRVALLEKKQFVELHLERAHSRSIEGAVVKGRVSRVLPGMQAAFVDIGLEKAAFLYAGDYVANIEDLDDADEGGGRGRRRRSRHVPNIETLLREGEEIVVQIAKEPIGTKGARITSHVSIAGRHLVLTPWATKVGVSRKIDSDKERRRLRDIVKKVKPEDLGFIIRTAGESVREADLAADVKYLTTVWDDIQIKKDQVRAPAMLYQEPELALRVIRDFTTPDTKRIVIDSPEVHEQMKTFIDEFIADPKPKLDHYKGLEPIFDHFGTEATIDGNLGRKAWLKSGGYLIIDQSEALTAIDVNTGRYVGKHDLEETVLRTNLEAVREVVNQLRFRNIGGLIIIDLIDMESAENRDKVNKALAEAIRGDKAKTNVLKISELGLVEMTRKRTRENLVQMLCEPCSYCEGKGYVLSDESMANKILREIRKDLPRFAGRKIAVTVNRRVAEQLLVSGRKSLEALEAELGREIEVRARADIHQEQFEVTALEEGAGAVALSIPWLDELVDEQAKPAAKEPAKEQDAPESAEAPVKAEASEAELETEPAEASPPPEPEADAAPPEPAETAPESAEVAPEAAEAASAEALAELAADAAASVVTPVSEPEELPRAESDEPDAEEEAPAAAVLAPLGETTPEEAPPQPPVLAEPVDSAAESSIIRRSQSNREDS